MARVALRIAYVLLALALVAGGLAAWGYAHFARSGPLAAATTVIVPRGAGVEAIARALARANVIADPLVFRVGARLTGADKALRAGEYAFPAGISPASALALLESGKTVVRRLTVVEGVTTVEVVAQLAATDGLKGEVTAVPGEGLLLPETYHFSYGDSRDAVLARMAQSMQRTLDALWRARADDVPFAAPKSALILASVVEKETAIPEERARIAAVFINRLRRRMRLQSDPTVAYGLTQGSGPLGRPLTASDLKVPTPYNTYLVDGLPPGPICNPGRASIAAVLDPARTDELYFVADGSGGHVFARTLAEHSRNVARWRTLQRRRLDSRKYRGP